MNKIKNWIKSGNVCEECPYCWETRTSYEYDEYDYGCYIKGNKFEDSVCRLIKPIRFILGTLAIRKSHYYESRQYDGVGDWYAKEDKLDNILVDAIIEQVLTDSDIYLCYKGNLSGDYKPYPYPKDILRSRIIDVRSEYDKELLPKPVSLRQEWIRVLHRTGKCLYTKTLGKLVPYIVG